VCEIPEVKVALTNEVEEATRGGDEDVDTTLNLLPLGSISDATIN
jgi:hypothetical protein